MSADCALKTADYSLGEPGAGAGRAGGSQLQEAEGVQGEGEGSTAS
jgi:hypothetical protein